MGGRKTCQYSIIICIPLNKPESKKKKINGTSFLASFYRGTIGSGKIFVT